MTMAETFLSPRKFLSRGRVACEKVGRQAGVSHATSVCFHHLSDAARNDQLTLCTL